MKTGWRLSDLVDLEFFLQSDERLRETEGEQALKQRDRAIYLSRQREFEEATDNRSLLKRWLAVRRMQQTSAAAATPLPGDLWRESTTLMRWLILLLGLMAGAGAAASLLNYSGQMAVNVSGYFSLFVLFQLLLLILQILLFAVRLLSRSGLRSSVVCRLAASAVRQLFFKLLQRGKQQSRAELRLQLQAALGRLQQSRQEYGNLYFWPAFVLLQLFGCSFNSGVLATTLIKLSIADIAFGWQSTLQIAAVDLAELIRLIALPWSWLLPPQLACPTLEHIEGSRIILKEGIYHLATNDLVAWWPFLLCGVVTYGLLPRLLLLLLGSVQTRRSLKRLRFDSVRFRQLQQRMLTPALKTQSPQSASEDGKSVPATTETKQQRLEKLFSHGSKLLLLPDELWDELDQQELTHKLIEQEGNGPYQPLRFGALEQTQEQLFIQLAEQLHEHSATGVVLLQEAWQPPIEEILALLQRMRYEIPRNIPVSVVLIGKPERTNLLTPVKGSDLNIWRKTLQGLGDPYLAVYPLLSES